MTKVLQKIFKQKPKTFLFSENGNKKIQGRQSIIRSPEKKVQKRPLCKMPK